MQTDEDLKWLFQRILGIEQRQKDSAKATGRINNGWVASRKNIFQGSYDVWDGVEDSLRYLEIMEDRLQDAVDRGYLEFNIDQRYSSKIYRLSEKAKDFMAKTRVDLERVRELQAEIARINAIPVKNLELYEDGKQIFIPWKLLEDWKFTGLPTFSFVEMWPIKKTDAGVAQGQSVTLPM